MKKVPYLDLRAQFEPIRNEVLASLTAVCESARFAQGPPTLEFEEAFAAYCGVKHCVGLNSGTSALHLAMRCLDIGPGDEVIVPALTFIATAWGVSYVGAKPVFADVDPIRRTLDPKKVEAAITPRTKAIIPVHLFGAPADMDEILAVAARHNNIPVVEDAAQAHGAVYKGRRVGSIGCISCFSFYPGKNLGAYGEGGALLTDNEGFAARARALSEHAQSTRYYHDEIGYNYRMDSFQGAVLCIKLKYLDEANEYRRAAARRYAGLLRDLPLTLPADFADANSVWHCYVVEIPQRDEARRGLEKLGIETGLHYPLPLHLQKAYRSLDHQIGDFPVSEAISRTCLSLPLFPEITKEQQRYVADGLRRVLPKDCGKAR